MKSRSLFATSVMLGFVGAVHAMPYNLNGTWIEVDAWAADGSPSPTNETVVIIDWNDTNGPYLSESHAWGYRWSGTKHVLDALNAIAAAGALDVQFGYGGGFLLNAYYDDPAIDTDHHTTAGYDGWCWSAGSADGGRTWELNAGGADTEILAHNQIEAFNFNPGSWTGDNLSIPVPEPATAVLLLLAMTVRRSPKASR